MIMRGEVYDGRGFIKTVTGGPQPSAPANQPVERPPDIGVDMKLGAVVGYDGEAIRESRSQNVAPRR